MRMRASGQDQWLCRWGWFKVIYGHSAGTTIGMWDSQGGVPFNGDYPLQKNTAYAIELNTTVFIEEWDKDIRIMLEEAGFLGDDICW